MALRRKSKTIATAILAPVVLALSLSGCQILEDAAAGLPETTSSPITSADASAEATAMDKDYYTVLGKAQKLYNVSDTGMVSYCDLDELDRAVCAYGELTSTLRKESQARGREDITVNPTGWTDNAEVRIPALVSVPGSNDYKGWMFNRSHLVADSLGGAALHENLVTGTRTQNVGSTQPAGQYSGGMAYTELIARDYLDAQGSDTCPLYYAATPNYSGNELVPRSVDVDIQACDKSIDQHVVVYNTANGFEINYATGGFTATN